MLDSDNVAQQAPFRDVYTISRLNREARGLLEGSFPLLWIEGEISNLARPASGHLYFSLKDEAAQVRCAMFRNRRLHIGFTPQNGKQVLVRARISLYEARGDFQIIVEHMEEAGDGALRRAFEALKQGLDKEGLFQSQHKQALPKFPRCVGVITSPSSAAVRDVITTLQRRFPSLPVIVYPVAVQGTGAAEQIAAMIRLAEKRQECDVFILGRGGGSLEDLWAFNEEVVARAIYACQIPIVSAVGHEIDFTIADFVADQRAATPTAAAELISPEQTECLHRVRLLRQRLSHLARTQLHQLRQRLQHLEKRLQHPGRRLREHSQRLDELTMRLQRAQHNLLRHAEARFKHLQQQLLRQNPVQGLTELQAKNRHLSERLKLAIQHRLTLWQKQLQQQAHALNAVSPLATLSRGYAIVQDSHNRVIHRASQVNVGDTVKAKLAEGQLNCKVIEQREEHD